MNLLATVYSYGDYGVNPPRLTMVPCQLRSVAKMTSQNFFNLTFLTKVTQELLVPAGTDLRGPDTTPVNTPDSLTIDAYGGSYEFVVQSVYDVAKGFTNEYRVALIHLEPNWSPPLP